MQRRQFLQCTAGGVAATMTTSLLAKPDDDSFETALRPLVQAVEAGQVKAAAVCVRQRDREFRRAWGMNCTIDSPFLLGSISKPICVTALMTLYDRGEFRLDDPLKKFIPAFTGEGRDRVTMKHLLTHVSGLPDQLADNDQLRRSHAPLPEFVEHAVRTPLGFAPGTKYEYSSMAILLATHVAEIVLGQDILKIVTDSVFTPLGMRRSAQGMGNFSREEVIPVQTEFAAPESGGGDPTAKEWDWNSDYWRKLGAPWGGTQCSAPDVATFLQEFLLERSIILKAETERLMVTNHNPAGITPRGLGFNVGVSAASPESFGHTGSTGTITWADQKSQAVCVVLTSLPGRAVDPHPRQTAADRVAAACR